MTTWSDLAKGAGIKGGQGRSDEEVAETGHATAWFVGLGVIAFVIYLVAAIVTKG